MFSCGIRKPVKVKFTQKSLTQQQFKKDCDIHRIVKHYTKYGVVPEGVQMKEGKYMDTSVIPSFMEAQNMMKEAERVFYTIPLDIRRMCDHDPAKVMDYLNDPKNKDILKKYGLLKPEEKPQEPSFEQKVVNAVEKGFENLKNPQKAEAQLPT